MQGLPAAKQIIFYDEKGAWRYVEPQQGRDPVLIFNGQDLMVLNSDGEPFRLLPSASSPDTVVVQGIRGEFYAIKPDVEKACPSLQIYFTQWLIDHGLACSSSLLSCTTRVPGKGLRRYSTLEYRWTFAIL